MKNTIYIKPDIDIILFDPNDNQITLSQDGMDMYADALDYIV